jgi:hypothetical protein
MHPTHRHTLLYRLADPRTTASERETLRAELAAGRDLPQETVAEWIRPRKSAITLPRESIHTNGGFRP